MNYLYEKYLVKSHLFYWVVILCGLILFVTISWDIEIDQIGSLEATYVDGNILLNDIFEYKYDYIYVYKNKSETVSKCEIKCIEYIDNQYTLINLTEELQNISFEGNIKLDFVYGKTNLLKIVFGIDQKYMEKRYV